MSEPDPYLAPISAAEPAGKDARHEPEHEAARAEIDKLGSIAGAPVDWQRVEINARSLLAHKSKDLVIGTFLACALHERDQLDGLDQGLRILVGLLQGYGHTLFPLRTRARVNALDWFIERTALRLGVAQGSLEQIASLKLKLQALETASGTLVDAQELSFVRLRSALDRMVLGATSSGAPEVDAGQAGTRNAAGSQESLHSDLVPEGWSFDATTWLVPISEQAPSGSDVSYGEGASLIRQELVKLEALSGDPPNWPRIFAECDRLLRTETKDLVIATQLTQALYALHGFKGLALGLTMIEGLLSEHWDGMWPPLSRLRRRGNALSSLMERLSQWLAKPSLEPPDSSSVEQVEQATHMLASAVERRFGTEAPSFHPLTDALRKLRETPRREVPPTPEPATVALPAPSSETRVQTSTAGTETASAPSRPLVPQTPSDARGVETFLGTTSTALVQTAALLREAHAESALACRLLRTAVWLEIDAPPAADENGKTRIPAPDRRVQKALAGYLGTENWRAVLAQTEGMLPDAVFWLDLQFYAARAHRGLGGGHARLAELVHAETLAFLRRLPGLCQLRFSDGSPLASPETLAWLEPAPSTLTSSGANADASHLALPDELRQAVLRSDPAAGPSLDLILQSAPARSSFYMRLELAAAFLTRGAFDSGITLLLGLEQELDVYQLERWEPDLALHVLKALCSALQNQRTTTGVVHPEAARVCARLARLLPSALL